MIGMALVSAALCAGIVITPHATDGAARGLQARAGVEITPAEATPFLGDWTLALEGPDGPGAFDLSLRTEKDTVVGEISSAQAAKQPITTMSVAGKDLILRYTFDHQGTPVDTMVSLKPAADGKVVAQIDFAGGAYVMTGTATKKGKSK